MASRARVTQPHVPPEGEEIRVYPGDPLSIAQQLLTVSTAPAVGAPNSEC